MQNGSLINSLLNLNTAPTANSPAKAASRPASAVDFQRLVEVSHAEYNRPKVAASATNNSDSRPSRSEPPEAASARDNRTPEAADTRVDSAGKPDDRGQDRTVPAQDEPEPTEAKASPAKSDSPDKPQAGDKAAAKSTDETADTEEQNQDAKLLGTTEQSALESTTQTAKATPPLAEQSLLHATGDAEDSSDEATGGKSSPLDGTDLTNPLLAWQMLIPQTQAADAGPLKSDLSSALVPGPLAQAVANINRAMGDAEGTGTAATEAGDLLATGSAGDDKALVELAKFFNLHGKGQSGSGDAANFSDAKNQLSAAAGDTQAAATGDTQLLSDKLINLKALLAGRSPSEATAGDKPALDTTTSTTGAATGAATAFVDSLGRPLESMSPAARTFAVQTGLAQSFGHPQWSQAVGDRVLWLAAQNLSAADIRLDPPDLGSMHVKVAVHDNQASVSFVSPHPVVREALDQQATRLREMFADQGLNLVHVDVSDRHANQQQGDEQQGQGAGAKNQAADEDESLSVIGATSLASMRLVDHYA